MVSWKYKSKYIVNCTAMKYKVFNKNNKTMDFS